MEVKLKGSKTNINKILKSNRVLFERRGVEVSIIEDKEEKKIVVDKEEKQPAENKEEKNIVEDKEEKINIENKSKKKGRPSLK